MDEVALLQAWNDDPHSKVILAYLEGITDGPGFIAAAREVTRNTPVVAIKSGTISFNEEQSPFNWVDLFAAGPATLVSWTSSYSETGVLGEAELANAEKGQQAYEEAVRQLVRFIGWFKERPRDARRDLHRTPPTMPMPWGQTPIK